ncbi:hypothetical protein H310_06858 [Aphanomyces invadans]|uniref:Orn/DAP/Arg decarboxylase 2 N-terminal domain-containing protein n=1 Tax=Aphanomyces invadans TaxID=157072 RepID=A0A024U4W7_9STRA|nr:hypothetical protein H310_06858 [Aphanomyces invadans]ETW01290.1 hypothetical protein H310_06858 [Aphanomyces invadans]|eukprot:XP_008870288.1 hypothetical protein H310_06858 [Aphanomyces invadans]
MERVRAVDLSQYQNESKSAEDTALDICREMGWDPTEVVHVTLQDLIAARLSSYPSTIGKSSSPTQELDILQVEEAQHHTRGSSVQGIVKHAVSSLNGLNAVDLISIPNLKARLASLNAAFPGAHFNHAIAVKANPIRSVLRIAQEMGFGAECASFAEVHHALRLGFPPRSVVFDSPCKTYAELAAAIRLGCYVNLDNEDEIAKVECILTEFYGPNKGERSRHDGQIGLRINPVVGGGSIASTSTATSSSKFGLPWTPSTQARLIEIYLTHRWLQGVHIHVGSQGCALDLLVAGAKRAVEFSELVNAHIGVPQVQVVDIGGGLPTVYDGVSDLGYEDYAAQLRIHVPDIFSTRVSIVTEFGRSVFVKAGITLTKVESVKQWEGQNIAVVHVGANQFLRTAYLPHQWPHVLSVFDATGALRSGPFVRQDIAGPLCFSGDFLAKQVWLPQIQVGDYIVIHDTGGYTVSMYSKYNSRPSTAIYGYDVDRENRVHLTTFKEEESVDQVLAFWGP